MKITIVCKQGNGSNYKNKTTFEDESVYDFEIEKGAEGKGLVLSSLNEDEFGNESLTIINLEWEDIERIIKSYKE